MPVRYRIRERSRRGRDVSTPNEFAPRSRSALSMTVLCRKSIVGACCDGGEVVKRKSRFLIFAICIAWGVSACVGQNAAPSAREPQRKTSEPYRGDLSIFDSPGRDQRLQVNRVMDVLGISPGKAVADIGAGSGWFTVRAARRTETGTVYAVDINPKAAHYIDARARKEKLGNVKTIVSTPDDPKLPEHSVDAVLLLKAYHEVAHPVLLLRNLRPALRADAKVGIIDRDGNGEDHGVDKDVVIREAKEAGYKLVEQYDFVKPDKEDYFLVFTAED